MLVFKGNECKGETTISKRVPYFHTHTHTPAPTLWTVSCGFHASYVALSTFYMKPDVPGSPESDHLPVKGTGSLASGSR